MSQAEINYNKDIVLINSYLITTKKSLNYTKVTFTPKNSDRYLNPNLYRHIDKEKIIDAIYELTDLSKKAFFDIHTINNDLHVWATNFIDQLKLILEKQKKASEKSVSDYISEADKYFVLDGPKYLPMAKELYQNILKEFPENSQREHIHEQIICIEKRLKSIGIDYII